MLAQARLGNIGWDILDNEARPALCEVIGSVCGTRKTWRELTWRRGVFRSKRGDSIGECRQHLTSTINFASSNSLNATYYVLVACELSHLLTKKYPAGCPSCFGSHMHHFKTHFVSRRHCLPPWSLRSSTHDVTLTHQRHLRCAQASRIIVQTLPSISF